MSGVIPAPAGGEFDYLLRAPPTRAASAADAAHHDRLRGAQRDCRRAVRLRLVNNESRQLALLRARLEVICETLAQLRAQAASARQ
jgi:hypothetical protein